jgi:hypothetical protein
MEWNEFAICNLVVLGVNFGTSQTFVDFMGTKLKIGPVVLVNGLVLN